MRKGEILSWIEARQSGLTVVNTMVTVISIIVGLVGIAITVLSMVRPQ